MNCSHKWWNHICNQNDLIEYAITNNVIKYAITNYLIKYASTNDVIKYAITNDEIIYAVTNDVIKYAITNYVINKKIFNNFVFPNTPAPLTFDDTCLFDSTRPLMEKVDKRGGVKFKKLMGWKQGMNK